MSRRRNDLEITIESPRIASQIPNSDQSPLYDVRNPARASCKGHNVRSDVSRTMFSGDVLWRCSLVRRKARRRPLGYAVHRSVPAWPCHAKPEAWWSQTGSNRRPHACKARALPAELWPRTRRRMLYAGLRDAYARSRWWAWEDLNFRPHAYQARALTN